MSAENEDIETRKRRALYRANYRGTKEMDLIIGRYAKEHLETMNEQELGAFEEFLEIPDRDLENWIMRGEYKPGGLFETWVNNIRDFHGLSDK